MEKKPILFESACIFSFLGSGIGFLYLLISALFFNQIHSIIIKISSLSSVEHLTPLYFACLMAGYALSLAGIIKIWRMQRSGLYIYLVAQVMILNIPIIWLGPNAVSNTNIIFALLFSGIYIYYYRQLA